MDASISKTIAVTILTLVLSVGNGSLNKTVKPTLCSGGSGHERGLKSYQTLCSYGRIVKTTGRKPFDYQIDKPSFAFARIENNRVKKIQV
jgi:hypothetical protein